MKFKKNYDEKKSKGITFKNPSRTKQEFRDENNPYNVIYRHTKGLPVSEAIGTPQYLDVSNIDPLTHNQKIQDLSNTLDEKTKKLQKDQNELNEKLEKEKYDKYVKEKTSTESKPGDKA